MSIYLRASLAGRISQGTKTNDASTDQHTFHWKRILCKMRTSHRSTSLSVSPKCHRLVASAALQI
jgi:hypothetical protein